MTIAIINQVIRAICEEITVQKSLVKCWQIMPEDNLLYEVAVCIFSSQNIFEIALLMADRLREQNLLQPITPNKNIDKIEKHIVDVLSQPLVIEDQIAKQRLLMPRFKNRQASLLATTMNKIYGQSLTIHEILHSAPHAQKARKILTQCVWGFGPKQASLFLRRVGYSSDLAVLDVHVLDYLRFTHGLALSPHKLGRLSFYEGIENIFRKVAEDFGHPVGCVDLAIWLTMRVAKKEALL